MPGTRRFPAQACLFRLSGWSGQRTGAVTAQVEHELELPALLQVEPPGASRSTLTLAPPKADVTANCVVRTRCSSEEVVVSFMTDSLEVVEGIHPVVMLALAWVELEGLSMS